MNGTGLATNWGNKNFISKAPPEIVQKERDKLAEIDAAVTRLTEQLERLRKLIS